MNNEIEEVKVMDEPDERIEGYSKEECEWIDEMITCEVILYYGKKWTRNVYGGGMKDIEEIYIHDKNIRICEWSMRDIVPYHGVRDRVFRKVRSDRLSGRKTNFKRVIRKAIREEEKNRKR